MTVAYLQETAEQAGLDTEALSVEQIGWDRLSGRFVDDEAPLHPQLLQALPVGVADHRPLRPARPRHPRQRRRHRHHLLDRARLEDAAVQQGAARDPLGALPRAPEPAARLPRRPARAGRPTAGYVAKPLLGREGAGVTVHEPGGATRSYRGRGAAATRSWPRCPTSTATGWCSARGSSRTRRRGSASASRRGWSRTSTPASCPTSSSSPPVGPGAHAPSTARSWSSPQSRSSLLMTSGGAIRIVDPWVSFTSTPQLHQLLGDLPARAVATARCRRPPTARARAPPSPRPPPTSRPSSRCRWSPSSVARCWYSPVRSIAITSSADRAGQRVPAERRAVLAGPEHPEHVRGRRPPPTPAPRRRRAPCRGRTRPGTTPSCSHAKVLPVRPEARLDLVRDEQHVPLARQLPYARAGIRPAAPAPPPRPGSAPAARPRCSR